MTGSGDSSRRCVASLDRAIFSDSSSRCRPANFIWSEWRICALLRDYLMRYHELRQVQNFKRWIPQAQNYAISPLLGWCPCSCMRLFAHRQLPVHHFSTLIPQLSSFYLSVRVKWKSEVLYFRCFSPFKRKGKTLFSVLHKRVDCWNRKALSLNLETRDKLF